MKSFMEYLINESETLDEAHFERLDFFKVKDRYLEQLIADIIDKHVIAVGTNKDDVVEVEVPKELLSKFKEFQGSVDFNNLKDEDLSSFNNLLAQMPKVKTPSGKDAPLQWSKIWKGKYSEQGKNLKGGQAAKLAEAATAFCYNEMHKIHEADTELNDKQLDTEVSNVLKSAGIQDVWIKSSKITAKKIDLETKQNNIAYIAAHVDGNDISDIPAQVKHIAKIFSGKEGIKKVFGKYVDAKGVDMLYPGTQKDMWNKADIVLISDNLNIAEAISSYLTLNNVAQLLSAEEINNFINNLITQKFIVPISLKGIVIRKNTTLNDIAYESDGKLSNSKELNDIENVTIELPAVVKDAATKKYNGSCYLKTNNNLQLTFRNKEWQKEALLIEIQLKGARGGNGLGLIQNKLNLKTGFYKNVLEENGIQTELDYLKYIENLTGQQLKVPQTLKDATDNTENPWYKRTAYKAMLSFMLKYRDSIQKSKNKVDLVNMFRLIYNCASGANSDSIYWLVKTK